MDKLSFVVQKTLIDENYLSITYLYSKGQANVPHARRHSKFSRIEGK
jgi:hypothetical protein